MKYLRIFVTALIVAALVLTAVAPAWAAPPATAANPPAASGTMAAGDAKGGLRYTVTVAKFENKAGWRGQWDIGDGWSIIMTDILNQTGKFVVLGDADMRRDAMNEQDLAAAGRTAQGAITPGMGNMTPAQIILRGAITHVQSGTSGGGAVIGIGSWGVGGRSSNSEVNVTMAMVHSSTGQVLATTRVVGKANSSSGAIGYSGAGWGAGAGGFKNDNLGKAVENAVQQGTEWMIKQLPSITWRGSIVMVRGNDIYINRGTREGVREGMEFIVGSAEAIRDPSSGEVLDVTFSEVGRISITSVKEKLAIATLSSGMLDMIKQGMFVQVP